MSDKVLFTHEGYDVTLDGNHRFYVEKLEKSFPTAEDAKLAIEARTKYEARLKKKALALDVIDSHGERRIITGIHASHDKILTKPPFRRYHGAELYPAVDWIVAILEHKLQLEKQIETLNKSVEEFQIDTDIGGWRSAYAQKNPVERLEVLEKDYADKKAAAEAKGKA